MSLWDRVRNPHKYRWKPEDWFLNAVTHLPGHRVYKDQYPHIRGAVDRPMPTRSKYLTKRNKSLRAKRQEQLAANQRDIRSYTVSTRREMPRYAARSTRAKGMMVKAGTGINSVGASRTLTKVSVKRRPAKKASITAAKQEFWRSQMPVLRLRTYPSALPLTEMVASSGSQLVISDPNENMMFPTRKWCQTICRKMHADMQAQSSNQGGGIFQDTGTTSTTRITAQNELRNGLIIEGLTRMYNFMNTRNSMAFVEIYELVWKGNNEFNNSGFQIGGYTPERLWNSDVGTSTLIGGDDPEAWGTSVPIAADVRIPITQPGVRPNRFNKLLWRYWKLEKTCKYRAGPGETITHTVKLPSMKIDNTEMTHAFTASTTDYRDYIPGKTRAVMMILYGQLGFEGATGTGNGSKLDLVPAGLNWRWRQETQFRLIPAGTKHYTFYSCAHDLTTAAAEHTALTTPQLVVIDPADLITVADQDT